MCLSVSRVWAGVVVFGSLRPMIKRPDGYGFGIWRRPDLALATCATGWCCVEKVGR